MKQIKGFENYELDVEGKRIWSKRKKDWLRANGNCFELRARGERFLLTFEELLVFAEAVEETPEATSDDAFEALRALVYDKALVCDKEGNVLSTKEQIPLTEDEVISIFGEPDPFDGMPIVWERVSLGR